MFFTRFKFSRYFHLHIFFTNDNFIIKMHNLSSILQRFVATQFLKFICYSDFKNSHYFDKDLEFWTVIDKKTRILHTRKNKGRSTSKETVGDQFQVFSEISFILSFDIVILSLIWRSLSSRKNLRYLFYLCL